MFSVYDLYDLHMILVAIRSYPEEPFNTEIVSNIITVLNNRIDSNEPNQLRKALQSIKSVGEYSIYDFVYTENKYTYFPLHFLNDEGIYSVLEVACRELLCTLCDGNIEKIIDLTDCLHNLPILIVENRYLIPKSFWNNIVNHYRNKWNNDFLRFEQSKLKRYRRYSI